MLRLLFTAPSALSLLLCAAAVVFWVRSYRSGDRVPVRFAGQPWRLVSERGRVVLDNQPEVQRAGDERRAWDAASHRNANEIQRYVDDMNGRQVATRPVPPRITQISSTPPDLPAYLRQPLVPWALLVAVTAVLPVAWAAAWWCRSVLRRRLRLRLCVRCGYDLRATPGRCPECGVAPAEVKA